MDKSGLFTFLVEYKGGTYVKQLTAPTVSSALSIWRTEVLEEFAELSETPLACFRNLDSNFVQLEGYVNAWCLTATVDDAFFLMNIVATVTEARQEGKAI
jgi:hypothetical protein